MEAQKKGIEGSVTYDVRVDRDGRPTSCRIGRAATMALSTHRVLKRRGRVVLVESGNPKMGIGYSVRIGGLALWNGDNLQEAERRLGEATK